MPVSDDIGRQTVDTTSLLFVASRDEPNGIPDDFFLLRALNKLNGNISYQFRLWTDMSEPDDNQYTSPPPPPQQVIIRSLWEGRTRQGSSPKLLQFFTETALRCPQMRYDYWLLDWTAHKSYLLQLAHANVKIVPSCLILASNVTNQGVSQFLPHIDTIESSPGGIKRAMLAHGWAEAILKPAVGTRCEGVMRLSLKCWTLSMAFRVASLLKDGDCILQPFLPPVACTLPAPSSTSAPARQTPPIIDGTANIHDPPLLGELCVLCIQGEITHAVHKNPILWGWHESSCLCSGSVLDLERVNSSCTCKATLAQSTRHHSVVSNLTLLPARSDVSPDLPEEVANLLKRAPVDRVLLPLPAAVVTTVHQVLDIIRDKSDGQVPLMCRLDFLPHYCQRSVSPASSDSNSGSSDRCNVQEQRHVESPTHTMQATTESTTEVEWLFSEMEGQWCEGFFRAAPERTFELFLAAAASKC